MSNLENGLLFQEQAPSSTTSVSEEKPQIAPSNEPFLAVGIIGSGDVGKTTFLQAVSSFITGIKGQECQVYGSSISFTWNKTPVIIRELSLSDMVLANADTICSLKKLYLMVSLIDTISKNLNAWLAQKRSESFWFDSAILPFAGVIMNKADKRPMKNEALLFSVDIQNRLAALEVLSKDCSNVFNFSALRYLEGTEKHGNGFIERFLNSLIE
ncbi:MAG: hypothetical protein ACI3VB_08950 [Oscillospiraceae bacterium]